MGRSPVSTRRIPVALPAAEVILTIPRPHNQGGNGWAALRGRATAGAATTLTFTAASTMWSDFEAGAFATADRFNGLRLKTKGRTTIITDYDGAGVLTFVSGTIPTPAAGDLFWIEADIPFLVSYLMMFALTDEVRFSTQDQAGLIAAGQYSTILANMSNLIIDNEFGVPGFRIRVASGGVGAATVGLDIAVP